MSRVSTHPVAKPVSHTPPPPPAQAQGQSQAGQAVPREKVAMRAYEKWLKSGCQHGCDRQHWLEAEAELAAEMARQTKR
jgi:hypothetical protein